MDISNLTLTTLNNLLGVWGIAYVIAFWLAIIFWTYRDARSRLKRPSARFLAASLSIAFFIPGVLIYLILRPRATFDERYIQMLQEESLLRSIEAHEIIED
jgi:hypothetical protein